MEKVSKGFKDAIYAPSRLVTAKVEFEIVDNAAYDDAVILPSDQAPISRAYQVANRKRDMSYRYATFERDYFILDGSMHIPPRPNEGENELGFWSGEICDETGVFAVEPSLSILFDEPHNSIGLIVTFDTVNNEYPSIFTLLAYRANDAMILAERVVNHNSPVYIYEGNLEDYVKVEIVVEKWTKGSRRVRITEVDFGLIKEYYGTELINLNIVEEMDLVGSTVPSNELAFTLDNQERLFNILNPNGIYEFLMPQQEIRAYMGLQIDEAADEYEFVSVGKYYLTEWKTDEGALTTTFTARDVFDRLETLEYTTVGVIANLYDLAVDILDRAKVQGYSVDVRLQGVSTNGFLEPISARLALQNIAIAGRAVIYQDRQGNIIIKRIEPLTTSTGFITFPSPDTYAGLTTPEVINDYSFQAIDFENTFAEPQIVLNEVVKSLIFVVYDGVTEEGTEVVFENPNGVKEGVSYKIENVLITGEYQASLIAEWMFSEYNMRAHYTANWRQNPALTCSDTVMIEDSFGQNKKARITKQEYSFEGFLTGTTEAKGGV